MYLKMEELLLRYIEGKTSEEEDATVEKWLRESEDNRKLMRSMQRIDFAAEMLQVASGTDVEEELKKLHRKMEGGRRRYAAIGRWMQRVAAVLCVPLLGGWLYTYLAREPEVVPQRMEVRTSPGMTAKVTLPDSTVVVLNSSSMLTYSSAFTGETREVELSGEAFFSVKKDAKRRFVVHTSHGTSVMVYGTKFNVDAYEDSQKVLTTLVEGKVGFSFPNSGEMKEVTLAPGQKLAYDIGQESIRLTQANVDVETSWKDGRLYFDNTPFEQVLGSLGKRYGVEFLLRKESLKKNSFTGVFVNQRLDRILEHFSLASGFRFRYIEDKNIHREKQIIEVY